MDRDNSMVTQLERARRCKRLGLRTYKQEYSKVMGPIRYEKPGLNCMVQALQAGKLCLVPLVAPTHKLQIEKQAEAKMSTSQIQSAPSLVSGCN
jgi:hypothetical protein